MEEENRNKLKIGIGAAAVVLTIGALAGFALKDGNSVTFGSPVYAQTNTYSCTRPLKDGYAWNGSAYFVQGETVTPTFTWNTEDSFSIKIGNKYLAPASSTNLKLQDNESLWHAALYKTNVVIQNSDNSRALLFRTDTLQIRHYALKNLGDTYEAVTFWTPDDYSEWLGWGCASVKGDFADRALYRLAYGTNKE